MLTYETLYRVEEEALEYWQAEVAKDYFVEIAQGKEIGHKLADLVDEKTTALLTLNHQTGYQLGAHGRRRARSMGDVWLYDEQIYHPVNVKTGIVGSEGQPNLVSLKKVLSAITARQIDSYYLLIVKMAISDSTGDIAPSIVFTDMLDWLDYVTFDSGPGQMMLKAKAFFAAYDPDASTALTITDKVTRLFNLYKDGERRLRTNRERDLKKYSNLVDQFLDSPNWTVTPATQRSLSIR